MFEFTRSSCEKGINALSSDGNPGNQFLIHDYETGARSVLGLTGSNRKTYQYMLITRDKGSLHPIITKIPQAANLEKSQSSFYGSVGGQVCVLISLRSISGIIN